VDIFKQDINALQEYISTGDSSLMTPDMVTYLEQLELVRSMYTKYKSQNFIIKALRKLYPDIAETTAYRRFYDALNFFYLNNDVKKEAWRNIYAQKFENAAQFCWEHNDMEGYRKNLESAMKARCILEPDPPQIPAEFYDRRVIIYQMDPQMVGLEKVSRFKLAEMIDNYDLSEKEKDKLRQDAGIIDVEFLEENEQDTPDES